MHTIKELLARGFSGRPAHRDELPVTLGHVWEPVYDDHGWAPGWSLRLFVYWNTGFPFDYAGKTPTWDAWCAVLAWLGGLTEEKRAEVLDALDAALFIEVIDRSDSASRLRVVLTLVAAGFDQLGFPDYAEGAFHG